jgi:hypothetical protein
MPKNKSTCAVPQSSNRVRVFDKVHDLGMRVEELGRNISRSAPLFPASSSWILDDLRELARITKTWSALLGEEEGK